MLSDISFLGRTEDRHFFGEIRGDAARTQLGRQLHFRRARIHRPGSIEELRRLVARSPRIRAVGARDSFNGFAD
jgi:hypothetical protein